MNIEQIAKIAHETNRAFFCQAIGDESQLPWESAPEWQKASAMNRVSFHVSNPGARASARHEHWLQEKVETGWIYGPVEDAEKKQHPCIVPYEQLPLEQRIKDYLFRAVVHAVVNAFVEAEKV